VALSSGFALPRWPGWRHLPRESRDTLFLLAVIAWTVLPHMPHLPGWCVALTGVVLAWRASLALTLAALPGRWILVVVLAVAAGLTFWSFRTLFGKEPGVTMAVVLMALKTLELRARRDAFVVFFLGFFLVLTHFLYSQTLPVAAAMLVSVWGLLTALVLSHMPVGQPSLRQAATLAGRTALLGAPIMALLFVLFPRIGPLWGVPQDGLSKTGLSNSMKMGSVAEVAQDDSIALRLRFDGAPPLPQALYLRGPVLSRFDGTQWTALPPRFGLRDTSSLEGAANVEVKGEPLRYEITLEPLRLAVIPLIEATVSRPTLEGYVVHANEDLTWSANRPIFERMRFEAIAHERFRHGPTRATAALAFDRELPAGYNPRTLEWAARFAREGGFDAADPAPIVRALLQHIRTGRYTYTLAADSYGHDAIDEFWLDRREGFCEHFAAAFVVVLRALGVPARVVTGYQGAEPMPIDGYWVVRQSSAHAWAEYWQRGVGWVRADPTAAVAPDRIIRSRRLVPAQGLARKGPRAEAPPDRSRPSLSPGMPRTGIVGALGPFGGRVPCMTPWLAAGGLERWGRSGPGPTGSSPSNRPPRASGREDVQAHVDVAARGLGVRADLVGGVRQPLCDVLRHARQADVEPGLQEIGVAGHAQVDFDVDCQVGRKLHLPLLGHELERGEVAGRPCAGEQLLGGRVRLDGFELVHQLPVVGRRELDVEGGLAAARGAVVPAGRGVRLAREQHFLDRGHGEVLSLDTWVVDRIQDRMRVDRMRLT